MKNRAYVFLKQLIADLKSKTLAIKSKTKAMKARLIIFSLVMNKRYVMSSISDKFQSVLGHHSHPKQECLLRDDSDNNKSTVVLINESTHSYEGMSNPSEIQVMVEDKDLGGYESCYMFGEHDDGKYQDVKHTKFGSEDVDCGSSVIDLVKNCKEEEGQDFKMEDEIDQLAERFIHKFRRQILLQMEDSSEEMS